jgi:hypothetical protein
MQQRVHCLDNGANVRFRASSTNPDPAGLLGQLFRQVNGDHKDGNFRKTFRDAPGYIKPVEVRHLEIQQNHVRPILLYPLQGFSSGPSLIANSPGALLLEKSPKVMPDRRVVIDHENSNQAVLPSTLCPRLSTAAIKAGRNASARRGQLFNVPCHDLLPCASSLPSAQLLPWLGRHSVRNVAHLP